MGCAARFRDESPQTGANPAGLAPNCGITLPHRESFLVKSCAFTRFLKYLTVELPFSILCLSVTDLAAWFHWAGGQGLHTITELDCKE